MNKLLLALALTLSVSAIAHDEGHGPKLTDGPKNGGVLSPVVKESESKLGAKAAVVYKAELVRAEDGTATLYLYDSAMNPLPLAAFKKEAKGILSYKKSKRWKNEKFSLELAGETFKGKAPTSPSKPFNIDVILNDGKDSLLVAFDNLD